MSLSESMAMRNKWAKITAHWPVVLIIMGAGLTLVWLAMLIWYPLYLLKLV